MNKLTPRFTILPPHRIGGGRGDSGAERSTGGKGFLRYSPPWGGAEKGSWCLGWYTVSALASDNPNVLIPPKNGWKFNGGYCDPPTMGDKIVVEEIKVEE